MCNGSNGAEKLFKILVLAGSFAVLAAIPTFLSGLGKHSDVRLAGAMLLVFVGAVSALTGRIGLFWVK